ncbi:MAG: nucleotidyltransferase family protein [Thiotrichaceae bacterium]
MDDLSRPTAIILAGGLGTRLRPVIEDQPKVLAEIKGHPFLKYLLDQLVGWKIEEVVLCTGYLGDQIESQFGQDYHGIRLIYSREVTPLGTGGALQLALPLIKSDTVLVLNGDSYCAADFDEFWRWHCLQKSDASLLLLHNSDTSRFGRVQIATDGHIEKFDEKDKNSPKPGVINAGIYLIRRSLLESSIPDTGPISLERDVFPSWIGQNFFGYQTQCPFIDIGTPESYSLAEKFLDNIEASSK